LGLRLFSELPQGRIQSALLDGQRASGNLSDAQQHAIAMQGSQRYGFQDQQIQGARQQFGLFGHAGHFLL
jgi:hypothetical protein